MRAILAVATAEAVVLIYSLRRITPQNYETQVYVTILLAALFVIADLLAAIAVLSLKIF